MDTGLKAVHSAQMKCNPDRQETIPAENCTTRAYGLTKEKGDLTSYLTWTAGKKQKAESPTKKQRGDIQGVPGAWNTRLPSLGRQSGISSGPPGPRELTFLMDLSERVLWTAEQKAFV